MEKKIINYFSLDELCKSDTAIKNNITNIPEIKSIHNLQHLIKEVLNPLRTKFGKPILVTSGYRCKKLNELVGGVENSQHLTGSAADIVPVNKDDLQKLFDIAKEQENFDQLIWEGSWIHISWSENPRKQVLNLAK